MRAAGRPLTRHQLPERPRATALAVPALCRLLVVEQVDDGLYERAARLLQTQPRLAHLTPQQRLQRLPQALDQHGSLGRRPAGSRADEEQASKA